ncbi:GlsB/YeaQ/YmgE family stress response membrane protein, partial [Oenococcus oeni]
VGESLLGTWGPTLAGIAIIPSLIGAVIVVAIVAWLMMRMNVDKQTN